MKRHSTLAAVGGLALLTAASLTLGSQEVTAADHAEAPGTMADAAADIADFYAWHTDDGKIVAILTFASQMAGGDPAFDRDVLYTIHLDNTATAAGLTTPDFPLPDDNTNDNESDIDINIRFGQNESDEWGVQIEGMPGTDAAIQGAVGELIDAENGNLAQAGTYDDPFFFDSTGFNATVAAAGEIPDDFDLAFGSLANVTEDPPMIEDAPDDFEGFNVHAIVLEFDAEAALDGNADSLLQLWASSSRISE